MNKEIKKKDYLNIIFFGQKIKNQIAQYQRRINRLEAKKNEWFIFEITQRIKLCNHQII